MGWFLRKSFTLGPVRLNLSRSGLGAAVAVGPGGLPIGRAVAGLVFVAGTAAGGAMGVSRAGAEGRRGQEGRMRRARVGLRTSVGVVGIALVTGGLLAAPSGARAAGEADFVGLTPCRLVDTRGNGFTGAFGPPALAAAVPRNFPLFGQCGIPSTAVAVSLNVTATETLGPGFLLLFPQGGAQPLVSTLNYVAGETVANAAIVPLGAGGGLTVVAGVSGTQLVLDVDGYFEDSLVHDVGADNTFVGVDAGNLSATGTGNTAVGARALDATTTGNLNTAVGQDALASNMTGSGNTAIGASALQKAIGSNNTAIGVRALNNAIGGSLNTALGLNAGFSVSTGTSNIALGVAAGLNVTTGSNNIHIGHVGVGGDTATLRLGTAQTRAFVAGISGINVGAEPAVLVNSNGQLGVNTSSARFKEAIEPMGEASRGLFKLRPVSFRYRDAVPGAPRQYGLVAEEVAAVYPELVHAGADGQPLTVLYHVLPALLLNELQRQARVLEEKDRELQAERAHRVELVATVAELAARLARLEGRGPVAAGQGLAEP